MSEILIVDDMASNRYILRSLLEEAGYRVREATDGLQAVDAATEFPPDLVLMDINMPVMDGYEACRRIKQLPGQWCLPVLFISTNSGIGALEQAFQAGGCDYVSKPFHQLEVLARVQNQLRLKELGRQQAKAPVKERLERFVEFYPSILTVARKRPEVVDMRYPNGFALKVNGLAAAPVAEEKGKP